VAGALSAPATTSPSQVDREDLGHVAFTELGFPLFVILNLFQDNMRRLFVILKQVQDDERGVGMTVGVLTALPRLFQHRFQIVPRVARRDLDNIFRRALRNNLAAFDAAFGA